MLGSTKRQPIETKKEKNCKQAKLYELMQYRNASSCLHCYVKIFENRLLHLDRKIILPFHFPIVQFDYILTFSSYNTFSKTVKMPAL